MLEFPCPLYVTSQQFKKNQSHTKQPIFCAGTTAVLQVSVRKDLVLPSAQGVTQGLACYMDVGAIS